MAKHISLIQSSPDIRERMLSVINKKALSYNDLEIILEEESIPIDRAQLSRYLNNKLEQGSIMPEKAILKLCERLKIKVKLLVE